MNIVLCTSVEQKKYKLLQLFSITVITSKSKISLLRASLIDLRAPKPHIETES